MAQVNVNDKGKKSFVDEDGLSQQVWDKAESDAGKRRVQLQLVEEVARLRRKINELDATTRASVIKAMRRVDSERFASP